MGTVVTNYPRSVADVHAALGVGTVTHGWLCDELSGSLVPAFGSVTLAASGSGIIYGDPGPAGGSDRSVGFTVSSTGKFSGTPALFDIASVTDELVVVWIGKWLALPTAFGTICGKASGAFVNGWSLGGRDGSTQLRLHLGPGDAWGTFIAAPAAFMVGSWHAGIAVVDRSGVDVARLGVRDIAGTTTLLSSSPTGINGNVAPTASNFTVGTGDWVPGNDNFRLAALYVGKGPGVAAGLAAGMPAALQSLTTYVTRSDNFKAKIMRRMLPPPYKRDFGTVVPNLLTVIGQSDNLIGGLFGASDFLPDEG